MQFSTSVFKADFFERGHLYRHHRIHQCHRCKEIFESQEELDAHGVAVQGCNLRPMDPNQPVEGITSKLKEKIQCRKKAYPGQTEGERWQQMYQLIFPNEIAPNPCELSSYYIWNSKTNLNPI